MAEPTDPTFQDSGDTKDLSVNGPCPLCKQIGGWTGTFCLNCDYGLNALPFDID
jgi:hypothetical protein